MNVMGQTFDKSLKEYLGKEYSILYNDYFKDKNDACRLIIGRPAYCNGIMISNDSLIIEIYFIESFFVNKQLYNNRDNCKCQQILKNKISRLVVIEKINLEKKYTFE
jgi:hypothetical protein